jgi:hypothetical protein
LEPVPELKSKRLLDGTLELSWPSTSSATLYYSDYPNYGWSWFPKISVVREGRHVLTVPVGAKAQFFKLVLE